jgi:hypothetical protein
MKAFLKFNLPEEREEHEAALRGSDYKCTLDEFSYWLSRVLRGKESLSEKHPELTDDQYKTLEIVHEKLIGMMNDD